MVGAPVKHPLGFGNGKILEYPDGTAAYVKSMEFTHASGTHLRCHRLLGHEARQAT